MTRILLCTRVLPYPPDSGAEIRGMLKIHTVLGRGDIFDGDPCRSGPWLTD
jgi:hypothetical protein